MSAKRCERDSNPQSAFADHRFSRPAHYQLWHHSEIPRTGVEPVSPIGHVSLSHARFPVSHLGMKYRRRESNPQNSVFESDTYSSSVTPTKVPLVRFELTVDLSPARVLSPAHIPFCYRGMSKWAGLELHQRCFFVGDLQSLALASRHTDPKNNRLRGSLQTGGL